MEELDVVERIILNCILEK